MVMTRKCSWLWSCKNHETWSQCDHCLDCFAKVCYDILVYVPDSGGAVIFPSCGEDCDGGGGGVPNPNNPTPPKDDCAMLEVFYRMKPECNSGTDDGGELELENPCEKLLKMLQTPQSLPAGAVSIKDALLDLKSINSSTASQEEGYNFKYNPTNGVMYAEKITIWTPDDNSVIYTRTPNTFGGGHLHMDRLQGMFSHDDISVLYNYYFWFTSPPYNGINDSDYPQPVHMLVANGQVYALAIEPYDINYFRQKYNDILNGDDPDIKKEFIKNFEQDFNKLYSTVGGWNTDKTTLERTFLKFVTKIDNSPKHHNLKVSLYRANSNLTGWEKLTISKSGSNYNITPNPCN